MSISINVIRKRWILCVMIDLNCYFEKKWTRPIWEKASVIKPSFCLLLITTLGKPGQGLRSQTTGRRVSQPMSFHPPSQFTDETTHFSPKVEGSPGIHEVNVAVCPLSNHLNGVVFQASSRLSQNSVFIPQKLEAVRIRYN